MARSKSTSDKAPDTTRWHNLEWTEAMSSLGSNSQGLSSEEAGRRLAVYGPNELVKKKKTSPLILWLKQFQDLLIIILLAAVVLSAVLGEVVDSIVILVIVLFATTLGFIQEFRADKAMEALKKMAASTASTIRGGQDIEIPALDLVPGDIVVLRTGDRVPADGRLIEAANLKLDEAALTGESVAADKHTAALKGDVSIGDRRNMSYMGTTVVWGRGKAVVTGTGMQTEFGKIATLIQEVEEGPTPLQVGLARMSKYIAYGALSLCFVLAVIGVLRGHEILEMLIWGVSLAIAAVPEALPAVLTIGLALGVQRMSKRHALIRKLHAAETLGCTTVICSDKTGTLTQDEMTVRQVYADSRRISVTGVGYEPKGEFQIGGKPVSPAQDPALRMLFTIGVLCNDTRLVSTAGIWDVRGDPTEGALVVLGAKAGLAQEELNARYPRIDEIPFSSERKRMTTIHNMPEGRFAFSKGAPETIVESCSHIFKNGSEQPLVKQDRAEILDVAQQMASDALRVLGAAYRRLPDDVSCKDDSESGMVFVGMAGMIDPPRKEAKEAIRLCDRAGIKSVMITGDHKLTAVAVAKELGLMKTGMAVTGAELDKMSDQELDKNIKNIEVYARVSPSHKLRVIDAFRKKGEVVAMTGDGVNDAPALKKADIGVAMGISGTDVSKEAADMVLVDDNFASIVAAVEEGRNIFGNIKKFLVYLLSCNVGEIFLMAMAILFGSAFGLPAGLLPLVAVQILYVNLATDGLPAIALSVDPPDPDAMERKPRPPGQTVFTRPVTIYLVAVGIWTAVAAFGAFVWAVNAGKSAMEAQTICFVSLIVIEFFNAFNCRSLEFSLFRIGPFRNKWLLLALTWEIVMLCLVVYLPALHDPLNTYPLTLSDWAVCLLAGSSIFILVEAYKLVLSLLRRRRASLVSP